jgi:hypothetical protein
MSLEPATRIQNGKHTSNTEEPVGWLETNVDGSSVAEICVAALGAVIRDQHGETIMDAGKILKYCRNAEDGEAQWRNQGFHQA